MQVVNDTDDEVDYSTSASPDDCSTLDPRTYENAPFEIEGQFLTFTVRNSQCGTGSFLARTQSAVPVGALVLLTLVNGQPKARVMQEITPVALFVQKT